MPPKRESGSVQNVWNKRLNPHSRAEVAIIGGSTYPDHAENAATIIGAENFGVNLKEFADSETYTKIRESVRGLQVFIVQTDFKLPNRNTTDAPEGEPWTTNDSVFQTAQLVDASKRSMAKSITVIKPHFAYARQDRTKESRESVSANLHIKLLAAAGMQHLVTIDLHAPQTISAFESSDNVSATGLIADEIQKIVEDKKLDPEDIVFVSPDEGSLELPKYFADEIGGRVDFIPKVRRFGEVERPVKKLKDMKDKTAILVDDMFATGGTIKTAVEVLDRSNAGNIMIAATHGLFTGPAIERLSGLPIDKIITTNTVPQEIPQQAFGDRHKVIDVSPLIGAVIRIIATGGSMSEVYQMRRYRR